MPRVAADSVRLDSKVKSDFTRVPSMATIAIGEAFSCSVNALNAWWYRSRFFSGYVVIFVWKYTGGNNRP